MSEKPFDKEKWATWKAPGSSTPETPPRLRIKGLVVDGEKTAKKEKPEPVSRLRGDLVKPRPDPRKLRGTLVAGRETAESGKEFRVGDTIEVSKLTLTSATGSYEYSGTLSIIAIDAKGTKSRLVIGGKDIGKVRKDDYFTFRIGDTVMTATAPKQATIEHIKSAK